MPLFSSSSPGLKIRVLPRFPARVLVGEGITLSRTGLDYTFTLTYAPGQPPGNFTSSLGSVTARWKNLFLSTYDGTNGVVQWGPTGSGQVRIAGGTGSMRFLDSTAGYFFDNAVLPATADGAALGTASFPWSDLFLASGGIVNFSNSDVFIQHAANQLNFSGAIVGFFFEGPVQPFSNDGFSLGTASVSWSDLFLASGAVINWAAGDVTLTHSANNLEIAGMAGSLTITGGAGIALSTGSYTHQNAAGRAITQSDLREGIVIIGKLIGANFNSTADQAIPIAAPANYAINAIFVANASISLTTAVGGFYPTTAKGGTPIVAATQAYSGLTGAALNSTGSQIVLALAAATTTTLYNLTNIYFSLTTPQGAAATADIYVYARPLY